MEQHSTEVHKLMFVCTINRYRSVIGEYLFKNMVEERDKKLAQRIEVSSAGIVTKEQRLEIKERGISIPKPLFGYRPMPCVILYMQKTARIDVSEYRSKVINGTMAKKADLIITMSENHKDAILISYSVTKGKVLTLSELSRPFQFPNIVEEPPGLMVPPQFCMLKCDHWSLTDEIILEIKDRLEEAMSKILFRLDL